MPFEKKVLLVSLRADVGGGPKAMFTIAENLSKLGWTIYSALPNEEPYFEKFRSVSKDILTLPKRKFTPKAFARFLNFIRKNQIKLLHSHGKGAGIYTRLAKLFTGTKVIHHFHGIHLPKNPLNRILHRTVEKLLSKITDELICVSESEKDRVLELKLAPADRIKVVYNGLDFSKVKIRRKKTAEKIIVFVGRIDIYHKGIDRALRVISSLKNATHQKFKFYIVGDGEDMNKAKDMVNELNLKDVVVFLGRRDDVPRILSEAYIFFSMSRWEGLPYSVAEAMASGLPTVLSNVEGHKDLVKDETTGFLVNTEEEAVRKLKMLLENEPLAELIGRNASRFVRAMMSTNAMVNEIQKIYEEVMNK